MRALPQHWSRWLAIALLLLGGCALTPPSARPPHTAAPPMAATAHPLATQAALTMLARGGSAVDGAIAAQMVLGLVEPQSSGVGGGTLALHWDAATQRLTSLDGLAAAPARATPGLAIDVDGSALDAEAARRGGRSVGVPGTLALLEQLHQRHGKLPWALLFEPAIALAEQGFAMPRYLHEVLLGAAPVADQEGLRALYLGSDGKVLPIGATIRNPAYATTLRSIAAQGPRGWLQGGAAREIVRAAQRGYRASLMTEQDLLAYRAEPREPLCGPFLRYRVCVMGPSSYGGVAVLQTLQIVQAATPGGSRLDFDDGEFVHRFVEAGRVAQADRQRYAGDPAFVSQPLAGMLDADYLRERALRIDPQRAAPEVRAGVFPQTQSGALPDTHETANATSQIAIVDGTGNAVSVTTTINLNFGSWLTVGGFVLNNALSNFSPVPPAGQRRANQMAPLKRPLTSMTPTIVFDEHGAPVVVGGSAGGGQIVDYVAQSLIEMLAVGRTPAQALARGHVSTAVAGTVQLERGTGAATLAAALRAKGHNVTVTEMRSGLAFLKRESAQWSGAADPRRDGNVASPAPAQSR